jgi:hypothetical protein
MQNDSFFFVILICSGSEHTSIKGVVASVTEVVNEFLNADASAFVMLAKKLLVQVNRLCTLLNEEQYGTLPENFRKVSNDCAILLL